MMSGISLSSFSERAIALRREQMVKEARMRLAKNVPEAMGWLGRHARTFSGEAQESLGRLLNPVKGMREGWKELTPRTKILADKGKDLRKSIGAPTKWFNPFSWSKPGEHMLKHVKAPLSMGDIARGQFKGPNAKHLTRELQNKGRVQMGAEELSRRGWTGSGRVSKYMPVGPKGMITGFGAMAIPEVVNAEKATPTGEGGALEAGLGGLGSAAGMIAGTGVGLIPGTMLWYAMDKGGRKAGRVLDRLRSGASLGTALNAPSPQEANQQLDNVNRYYGSEA
jgi:hypothetical protein